MPHPVTIHGFTLGPGQPLAVIAGPCVIESRDHCLKLAESAGSVCRKLGLPFVFKASFDKANRTSVAGFRGPGLEKGLRILADVKKAVGVPVVTDIHEPSQAEPVAQVVDAVQIPAFMCRQTDLLVAAARTGKPVNVKKGQFMAPDQMRHAVQKVRDSGNDQVLLTERGTFFGYGRLVVDMTSLEMMRELAPVIFDATHSCQLPGGEGVQTGGQRRFTPLLSRAAVAAGIDGLFIEIHDQPDQSPSDAATVWPLDQLESLLTSCLRIREIVS
ncbi:MAG: 3-deoxy-8-phosphooctulonate synthase [Phycisphaerae bacterium]